MTKLEQLQLKVQILNITTRHKWWLTYDHEGIIVLCNDCFTNPEEPMASGFDGVNQTLTLQWQFDKVETLYNFLSSTIKEDLK